MMRLAIRSVAVLALGVAVSFGLYQLATAEVGGVPFGPNGVRPGFVATMGLWRALGGSAPTLDTSALGSASGEAPSMPFMGGSPFGQRRAVASDDGVQLGRAASDGERYAVLLGLGTFVGVVVETVWTALLRSQ